MNAQRYKAIRRRLLEGRSQCSIVKEGFSQHHVVRVVRLLKEREGYQPKRFGASGPTDRTAAMALAYLNGETQTAVATMFGVSRQRVHQVLITRGVPSRGHCRGVEPFEPSDIRWRKLTGRHTYSWRAWRAHREERRRLVMKLRELVTKLGGRAPTTREVNTHFGQHWQVLAIKFLSRNRRPGRAAKGLRRWYRLAGVTVRQRGGTGHVRAA